MNQYAFRSLCLAVGLFAAALPAEAFDYTPYAGVGLGSFIIDAGPGSKSAFGGYGVVGADFNKNVGAEIRFGATGKTGGTLIVPVGFSQPDSVGPVTVLTPTPAKVSIDWFVSYLLKLQYPFENGFRVYGVIGATTLKSRFTFASPVPPFTYAPTAHATTTTLSYGGGIDYNFGNQWLVGVDATVYSNKATTTPNANFSGIDVWGVTGTIKREF